MLMPSGTPLRPRQTAQNKIHDGRQIAGSGKSPIKACSNMVKWPSPQALNIGIEGLSFYPGYLDRKAQAAMVARIRQVCEMAPLFTPRMPKSGRPFSVRMSNCGSLGWVSDQNGYRYQASHPDTGLAWPPLPHALMRLWNEVADYPYAPEACLINFYNASARMGLLRIATSRTWRRPWSRFRSAIPACSGSAAENAPIQRAPFGSIRATWSSWGA
jgi:hypothetical protein